MIGLVKAEIAPDGTLKGMVAPNSPVSHYYGPLVLDLWGNFLFEDKPVARVQREARKVLLDFLDLREKRLQLERKEILLGRMPGAHLLEEKEKMRLQREKLQKVKDQLFAVQKARKKLLVMPSL